MSLVRWSDAGVRLRLGVAAAAALLAAGCATSPAPAPPDVARTGGPPAVAAGPGEVVGADAVVHLESVNLKWPHPDGLIWPHRLA
jgi:hypothetical protein